MAFRECRLFLQFFAILLQDTCSARVGGYYHGYTGFPFQAQRIEFIPLFGLEAFPTFAEASFRLRVGNHCNPLPVNALKHNLFFIFSLHHFHKYFRPIR